MVAVVSLPAHPVANVQVSSKLTSPAFERQSPLPNKPKQQLAVILLLGLDGSGKTTLLGTLQGEKNPRVRPSVGFKPVTMMLGEDLKVRGVLLENLHL